MKDSIQKRIDSIKSAETSADAKKFVCPFFEKGGFPDCLICKKDEDTVEECKNYYLERITLVPLDVWDESFDAFIVNTRDKVSAEDVVGIGINCDRCYVSAKCPLYKHGFVCGIDWGSNKPTNAMEFMDFIIDVQYERVKRAQIYEKIDGGVPDANLSGEMDRLSRFIAEKSNMGRERLSISVEASSAPTSSSGGILSKIFGGGSSEPKAIEAKKPDTFDITELAEEIPVKRKRKNERK